MMNKHVLFEHDEHTHACTYRHLSCPGVPFPYFVKWPSIWKEQEIRSYYKAKLEYTREFLFTFVHNQASFAAEPLLISSKLH